MDFWNEGTIPENITSQKKISFHCLRATRWQRGHLRTRSQRSKEPLPFKGPTSTLHEEWVPIRSSRELVVLGRQQCTLQGHGENNNEAIFNHARFSRTRGSPFKQLGYSHGLAENTLVERYEIWKSLDTTSADSQRYMRKRKWEHSRTRQNSTSHKSGDTYRCKWSRRTLAHVDVAVEQKFHFILLLYKSNISHTIRHYKNCREEQNIRVTTWEREFSRRRRPPIPSLPNMNGTRRTKHYT
jgi:hypothetical protein